LIDATQSSSLPFDGFGKNWIVSQKFSPDAFIQMAFQLAYYKLYNRVDSTYESANTKRFLGGRTECIRSTTPAALEFVLAWQDPNISETKKIELLRAAAQTHVELVNTCKSGYGVDRHWYGLHNLAKHKRQRLPNYEIPAIFEDPSYPKFTTSVLSTSNVSASCFKLFGFGAVCSNGLGIAYNIHNDILYFNITSYIGEAKNFANSLKNTLLEMQNVLKRNLK